jgi:hypothetical protein
MTAVVINTYLAVGPNSWGRGISVAEAVQNARKNLPTFNLRPGALLCIYRVDTKAYVDSFGDIVTPKGGIQTEFITTRLVKP